MLTVKSLPAISSTKYLKGAILTVIILFPESVPLRPHEIIKHIIRKKNIFLIIRKSDQSATNLTYNRTNGLSVANKII